MAQAGSQHATQCISLVHADMQRITSFNLNGHLILKCQKYNLYKLTTNKQTIVHAGAVIVTLTWIAIIDVTPALIVRFVTVCGESFRNNIITHGFGILLTLIVLVTTINALRYFETG